MTRKRVELKPCPFCGHSDLLQTDKMVNEVPDVEAEELAETTLPLIKEEEWFVVCGDCSAIGPLTPSAIEARAAWNQRATPGSGME